MCIAIPPPGSRDRAHSALWRALSEDPLRLLAFGASLQLLPLWLWLYFAPQGIETTFPFPLVVLAIYGIGGPMLLGAALHFLPQWTSAGPFHYIRYTGIFMLFLSGFTLFQIGLLGHWHDVALAGWTLVILGWFIGLQGVWSLYRMIPATRKGLHERLTLTAIAAGTLGAILLFSASVLDWPSLAVAGRCLGVWGLLAPGWLTLVHRLYSRTAVG